MGKDELDHVRRPVAMTPDEAIHAFAAAESALPGDALGWALLNWQQAAPRFLQLLDDFAEGRDRSDKAAAALFFVLHVIGGARETRAFPNVCRLLHDGEASLDVLGDAITETLRGILIGIFDGDIVKLKALVEDAATDDFIRDAALQVMAYFAHTGRIPEPEVRDYLDQLPGRLDPELDEVVLGSWMTAVALLGYEEWTPRVEAVFERADWQFPLIDLHDFREILETARADPMGITRFEEERLRPLGDVIDELSARLSVAGEDDTASYSDLLLPEVQREVLVNPFRHVGRNDPCPCGSGKKYKKCCLNA